MLFDNAVFNVLTLRIVFNVFSVMFAKTSLLFCCFCILLFVTNYVCVVPYSVMPNLAAIIRKQQNNSDVLANITENTLNTIRNIKNTSENKTNRIGKQQIKFLNFGRNHPSYKS